MRTIELTLPVEGHDLALPASPTPARAEEAAPPPTKDEVVSLWRLLRRLGVADSDVDDATQEVLIVVARRRASIPQDRLRSFVYGTALRVAMAARRRAKRRHATLEEASQVADGEPSADELVDRRRARETLDAFLSRMPFDLRTVFVLFEIEDLSTEEIARALDVPRGTVASRLRRAREDFAIRVGRLRAQRKHRGTGT